MVAVDNSPSLPTSIGQFSKLFVYLCKTLWKKSKTTIILISFENYIYYQIKNKCQC